MHHGAALTELVGDATLAETVASGRFDELPARLGAMCRYAVTLTRRPQLLDESVLDEMRAAGVTDREIIDVNQVVAYFNYVNRIAEGLGVDLESHWPSELRQHRHYRLAED